MSKVKSKYLEEASVEKLVESFNFFVPEIQREYVWGENYHQILDSFFSDLKDAKKTLKQSGDLKQKINELTEKGQFQEIQKLLSQNEEPDPMNIGFLYSYKPGYRLEGFPENDNYNDVYIIDGQQRLTTLFLTLFYHSIKEGRKNEFLEMFRYDKNISTVSFDYRVRNLTHEFIVELLDKIDNVDDFRTIRTSNWFLEEYASDPTVRAIVKAFSILEENFEDESDEYFNFLKQKIVFWHFKTDKTDQGEELYITMNSRGKQLEENETIRAKLFENIDSKSELIWSEKWEEWQDFFWINRDQTKEFSSADEGFNEFLKCISALEAYKKGTKDHFLRFEEPIYASKILEFISLKSIEAHVNSLIYLFKNKNSYKEKYSSANWVESCLDYLYSLIFSTNTNWFVRHDDDKRAGEYRKMVFVWSILLYLESIDLDDENIDTVFRVLRIYWLRYNNHDRSVSKISERVNEISIDNPWSLSVSDDEKAKHEFLEKKIKADDIREFEEIIWKIEDHPLNLNGYQVGLQNITHLVDFNIEPTTDDLNSINTKFRKLFSSESGSKSLTTILLFRGEFYRRKSPYYYANWDMSNWRRIIRDLDSPNNVFKTFFSEYNAESLNDILKKEKKEFALEHKDTILSTKKYISFNTLRETLCTYALIISDIWKHGRYIADYTVQDADENYLCEYEKNHELYNTKGDFRGYGHEFLWDMTLDNYPLIDLKHEIKRLISEK